MKQFELKLLKNLHGFFSTSNIINNSSIVIFFQMGLLSASTENSFKKQLKQLNCTYKCLNKKQLSLGNISMFPVTKKTFTNNIHFISIPSWELMPNIQVLDTKFKQMNIVPHSVYCEEQLICWDTFKKTIAFNTSTRSIPSVVAMEHSFLDICSWIENKKDI